MYRILQPNVEYCADISTSNDKQLNSKNNNMYIFESKSCFK